MLRLEVKHEGMAVGVAHPARIRAPMHEAQGKIDAVHERIRKMPWPFGVVTDIDDSADAFLTGVENRRPKIYEPTGIAAAEREILSLRLADTP